MYPDRKKTGRKKEEICQLKLKEREREMPVEIN
jgi:hypothetical protein